MCVIVSNYKRKEGKNGASTKHRYISISHQHLAAYSGVFLFRYYSSRKSSDYSRDLESGKIKKQTIKKYNYGIN